MGVERLIFPDPADQFLTVPRVPVDRTCPACGSDDVARYPIANYIGPRIVTRCQACFHVLELDVPTAEDMWPPFRSATYGWPASRAG
jgi:hypothetical protein